MPGFARGLSFFSIAKVMHLFLFFSANALLFEKKLSPACCIFSSFFQLFFGLRLYVSNTDDLGETTPLQLLQDDFESTDQEIRLKAIKRVKLVADVLGPEVTRSELIPFINSECIRCILHSSLCCST